MFPSILRSFSWAGGRRASLALAVPLYCTVSLVAAEGYDQGDAGLPLALACAGCHGTDGRSPGGIPSIAARPAAEFAALMRDFRDGRRVGTVMPRIAKGYDDRDVALLAAYFAKR